MSVNTNAQASVSPQRARYLTGYILPEPPHGRGLRVRSLTPHRVKIGRAPWLQKFRRRKSDLDGGRRFMRPYVCIRRDIADQLDCSARRARAPLSPSIRCFGFSP